MVGGRPRKRKTIADRARVLAGWTLAARWTILGGMKHLSALLVLVLLLGEAGVAAAGPPLVLFDEAHGERFLVGGDRPLDLSQLGKAFAAAGARVEPLRQPFSAAALAPARVLVISGAFAPLAPAETAACFDFVERGGRLAVFLHIGSPVSDLVFRLGVDVSNSVIHENENQLDAAGINFRVTRLAEHPITRGLAGFNLYGVWALRPLGQGVVALAETGPRAWVDLNGSRRFDAGDAMQSFAVAVVGTRGRGAFAIFGDDAMFQNEFAQGENRQLAQNLARWLLAGGAPQTAGLPVPPATTAQLAALP